MPQKRHRKSRRRGGKLVGIPFAVDLSLSTLGNGLVLSANTTTNAFGEDFFLTSVEGVVSLSNVTVDEGPITVGFAHSDLSDGEIQEALDAQVMNPDDIIAKERSRRPVRQVGVFHTNESEENLNDGNPKKMPMKFSIGNGFFLDMWARNRSGSTLTTGAKVSIDGTIFGRWQR